MKWVTQKNRLKYLLVVFIFLSVKLNNLASNEVKSMNVKLKANSLKQMSKNIDKLKILNTVNIKHGKNNSKTVKSKQDQSIKNKLSYNNSKYIKHSEKKIAISQASLIYSILTFEKIDGAIRFSGENFVLFLESLILVYLTTISLNIEQESYLSNEKCLNTFFGKTNYAIIQFYVNIVTLVLYQHFVNYCVESIHLNEFFDLKRIILTISCSIFVILSGYFLNLQLMTNIESDLNDYNQKCTATKNLSFHNSDPGLLNIGKNLKLYLKLLFKLFTKGIFSLTMMSVMCLMFLNFNLSLVVVLGSVLGFLLLLITSLFSIKFSEGKINIRYINLINSIYCFAISIENFVKLETNNTE